MTGLRINLFGEFLVRRGEELIEPKEWGRQKTRSLLKLLLTRPGRAFSRDEILEALWPGAPPKPPRGACGWPSVCYERPWNPISNVAPTRATS